MPRSAFAPVVSLGYLGMMAGGAIAGLAGDRYGRRTALLGSLFVFGVMTMAVAAADGVAALGVLRFLAGLGPGRRHSQRGGALRRVRPAAGTARSR